jgi:hypothetical protein
MIVILMALEFALLSILTFVLEWSVFNQEDKTMQCIKTIKTFVPESMSVFKTLVLASMSVFNDELSMSILNHAECIKTFLLQSMSILKTFVLELISVFNREFSMCIFNHAHNFTTMQCIKIFVMCITTLELFKFFMFSVPAMRSKVLICKALMGRITVLEETLKMVTEIDMDFFSGDTGHENTLVDDISDMLVDDIKAKLEVLFQNDGMDDNTKAAVELQFMNYVKVVYSLKKKHGYFLFGSKW